MITPADQPMFYVSVSLFVCMLLAIVGTFIVEQKHSYKGNK